MPADPATGKARTELNVTIGYVDRAASRLTAQSGHGRHALTLQRRSRELADVLAKLIAGDHQQGAGPQRTDASRPHRGPAPARRIPMPQPLDEPDPSGPVVDGQA